MSQLLEQARGPGNTLHSATTWTSLNSLASRLCMSYKINHHLVNALRSDWFTGLWLGMILGPG